MQKSYKDIIKYGKLKPFFDKSYTFNSIDIETVDNELFIFGTNEIGKYNYALDNFYNNFNDFLIRCLQGRRDILTWSKYDNTHLIKLILQNNNDIDINLVLKRIGKVTPIFNYEYKNFKIEITNIIKDSIIFRIDDGQFKPRTLIIYNLMNLFNTNLETTAKNYNIGYYSKIGIEYHIIDKERFNVDLEYQKLVLLSNNYDTRVLIDIAYKLLDDFKTLTGVYPKSIFTAGSLARSYLLARKDIGNHFKNFNSNFSKNKHKNKILDYSMQAYHGGKIDSYILGNVKEGNIIDITSAYPAANMKLPYISHKNVYYGSDIKQLDYYYYAFIKCNIYISDANFSHPLVIKSPINNSNLSPYGYIENVVITKVEYDYLKENNIQIDIIDFVGIEHIELYPYHDMINELFKQRDIYKKTNFSLSDLIKTIMNSLYGIKYELTPEYFETETNDILYKGLRAGDFFNPIEAAYMTAITRTQIARANNIITRQGGEILLNMTDSIIYTDNGNDINLSDMTKEIKTLGYFESPEKIKDIIILGAGRYEFRDYFTDKYTIKNRGFNVSVKDKSFYSTLDFSKPVDVNTKTFVTYFRATTHKYNFEQLGHLIPDSYLVNPFNLGGKRIPVNSDIDVLKEYTKTLPVYIEKGLIK